MDQVRNSALVEHIQGVVTTATTSQSEVDRERLQEAIELCAELDTALVPVGLVLAATAVLERPRVRPFLTRLPSLLTDRVREKLDRVSETLLMISDPDLQASGVIAASIFVQRALPDGIPGRQRILESLLILVDPGFKERTVRHSDVFRLLAQTTQRPTLSSLPVHLSEISDALEDAACDLDVFLDNPIDLVASVGIPQESNEQIFKQVRVKSGADIPMLNDELDQIETLGKMVGWTRDEALEFVTSLYARKTMDARSKIGLSVTGITNVIIDLKETLGIPIETLRVEDKKGSDPYTYEWDPATLVLFVGHRGTLSSRLLKEAHPAIVERLKEEKVDRETSVLEKAILRYQTARAERGGVLPSEEEEAPAIAALGRSLGLAQDQAYDAIATIYRETTLPLGISKKENVTLQGLSDLIDEIVGPQHVSQIAVDKTPDSLLPISVDRESRTLVLHTGFPSLSDAAILRVCEERSVESLPLTQVDAASLVGYVDSELRGSVSVAHNVNRFVEEFGLDPEHATPSFEDMLAGCSVLAENVTIHALRVLVATLNERLGDDGPIDLVAAFYRDLPDSDTVDHSALAWLTRIEEEDSMTTLTFNFNYGEGKSKVPPVSDEVLFDWCSHYLTKSMVIE